MGSEENVCPQAWGGRGGIAREVRRLAARPPPGVKLLLQDDDLSSLTAVVSGPADTPYEGGSFRVRLGLGGGYPTRPPRAVFETRIFHPNVSASGEVCVNTLARDWRPELGLSHALLAIRCLLMAPNPDSALNADAAALLRDDYPLYFARAKLYTDIHARHAPALDSASLPPQTGDFQESDTSSVSGREGSADEPDAKRERRAPALAPAAPSTTTTSSSSSSAARRSDKRRILKRL